MFLVLGLVTLFIIILVGVLLFKLSHISNLQNTPASENDLSYVADEALVVESKTAEELGLEQIQMMEEYGAYITDLRVRIESSQDSLDVLLSKTEDALLAIRVPKAMQEPHLNAVLGIAQLRVNVVNSPDGIREKMLGLLMGLSGK
ncbi:MAG: hypothetical protein HYV41_04705 [Candidatus Magasanikbacteria bacterium]|nr:hypothetical protein [Candidatus Magasanikbacteria bacterium]